ncbi:hypothetical protein GCM10010353_67510 [Streptomyces chryseus]|nr:hypothetical protein GCM10010353_67510 [Streptomyces chryseus]
MAPPMLVHDRPVPRTGQPTTTVRGATDDFLHRAAQVRAPARAEYTDAVLLVVTELVSNALRHTDGPTALHLELTSGKRGPGLVRVSPRRRRAACRALRRPTTAGPGSHSRAPRD